MLAALRPHHFSALAAALGLLLSGCASAPHSSANREPLNLSEAKAAVVAYVDEGRYAADLAAVSAEAKTWIVRRATARQPGERLAVVMDIDETVLSNLPHMRAHDFGYVPALFGAWVNTGEAPALPTVREVFATARATGVEVLFLTGREAPDETAATIQNLRREGLGDHAALVLKPADAPRGQSALERKTAQRAAWADEGWTLIATIGDQESDLGAHAERSFKLPNPFYRIP